MDLQTELFKHVSYGVGVRVKCFGSEAVVVRMFEANCDGRIPLLVRYDSGGEGIPMMDECSLVEVG